MSTTHEHPYDPNCDECKTDDTAIDWLMAVRKYGLEEANRMFPEESDNNSTRGQEK